jgi:hypothetical protein
VDVAGGIDSYMRAVSRSLEAMQATWM